MDERTRRIRLAKKRHRHEMTKKRQRRQRLFDARIDLEQQRLFRARQRRESGG